MANKNYIKGRAFEYKVMKIYRKAGYLTARTAGSHGPFDVIAINLEGKTIHLIQCKPKSMSYTKKSEIGHKWVRLNDMFKVRFLVM